MLIVNTNVISTMGEISQASPTNQHEIPPPTSFGMTLRSCRSDWHSVLDTFRRKVETLELTSDAH